MCKILLVGMCFGYNNIIPHICEHAFGRVIEEMGYLKGILKEFPQEINCSKLSSCSQTVEAAYILRWTRVLW